MISEDYANDAPACDDTDNIDEPSRLAIPPEAEVTTFTENGALTLKSSGAKCLDLFASIGALRAASEADIIDRFAQAFQEDQLLALRILFFARDIRGGLGERRTFRLALNWLAHNYPEVVRANLAYVPFFGRVDDLLILLDTELRPDVVALIKKQLDEDITNLEQKRAVSLWGKWLPSCNASNPDTVRFGKMLAKALGMQQRDYRRMLSLLRRALDIVETHLCRAQFDFDYGKLPGCAHNMYQRLFCRKDKQRYTAYLDSVNQGQAKINTATLTPSDIVRNAIELYHIANYYCHRERFDNPSDFFAALEKHQEKQDPEYRLALDTMWRNLPDYQGEANSLAVIDVSGSMCEAYRSGTMAPINVAVALGLYLAEHNQGYFHNKFLTFSAEPHLVEMQGNDIYEKVSYCIASNDWGSNTDIQAVFELILTNAINGQLPLEQMPRNIYIISDMEFDDCARNAKVTNFEMAKSLYARYGYELPSLVFWNVCSRHTQVPVRKNEQGAALVSGYSPRLFEQIFDIAHKTPLKLMLEIVGDARYDCITLPTSADRSDTMRSE